MKLLSVILTLFIISNTTLSAQNISADFSEKYNMFSDVENTIHSTNGWLMIKRTYDKTKLYQDVSVTTLLQVNDKMQLIKEMELPLEHKKYLRIKGLYKSQGVAMLLYSYKLEKSDKEYYIAAQQLDENTLTLGKEISLGQYSATRGNNTPYFEFKYAMDSSGYLLFTEAVQKRKDIKQVYFKVLNNRLEVINQKTLDLDAENSHVRIQGTDLDKAGNVYLQYRVYEQGVDDDEYTLDEDGRVPEYQTVFVQHSKEGKLNILSPDLQGNFLHTAKFVADKSGGLRIAGTYKATRKKRIKGIFFCSYDPSSNKVSGLKMNEVPEDILALLDKDKEGDKDGKDIGISSNFNPCNFSERNNGSFDLSLEFNRYIFTRVIQAGLSHPSAYVYSETILNINISNTGMIFTRIPKMQTSGAIDLASFNYSFYTGNKMIFLYNDDKRNETKDINKSAYLLDNTDKSVLMAAIVDEKGNVERKIVYSNAEDKYVTQLNSFKPTSANKFFLKKVKTNFFGVESNKFGILTIN